MPILPFFNLFGLVFVPFELTYFYSEYSYIV